VVEEYILSNCIKEQADFLVESLCFLTGLLITCTFHLTVLLTELRYICSKLVLQKIGTRSRSVMCIDTVSSRQCVVEACAFDAMSIVDIVGFSKFDQFEKLEMST